MRQKVIPSSFPQGNLPGYTGIRRYGLERVERGMRTDFLDCPKCQSPTILDTYISRRPAGDALVTIQRCRVCRHHHRTEEPFVEMPPIPKNTKTRLLRALTFPGQSQRTMGEELGRGAAFVNYALHRGCSPEALAQLEAHLDQLEAKYGSIEASWQAIEAGEPLEHVSEVGGATPAEAAQAFADRLLSQRLGNQRVIESEIRVRAPGQRIWQKFSVRLVALVEPKRSPGCCHPEVSDGR